MPTVSVIIPTYNHEKFINQTIESVLNQTFQDFEIIITDDGSTDNTKNIIKSFNDKRIKFFSFKENKGVPTALNNCLKHASSKYISLLGSDDLFEKQKLERQVSFLEKNKNIGAVFSWANIIDEKNNLINNKNPLYLRFKQQNKSRYQWLNYFFYKSNCLCASSALIRKSIHDKVGKYDERYLQLQDFDFWIRLCLKYEIYIIKEPLVKYRFNTDKKNLSADDEEKNNRLFWEHLSIMNNFLNIKKKEDLLKIFPISKKIIKKEHKEIIPEFIIAQMGLNSPFLFNKIFSLITIYKLMRSKKNIKKLIDLYNFNIKDLYKIAGKLNIYNQSSKFKVNIKNLKTIWNFLNKLRN